MGPGNRPLDLEWLEDFLALAETGNFSRAAQARSIAQPAFSRHIRSLEEWVGVDLFDRSAHPTALTAAGKRFQPLLQEVLAGLEAARIKARAAHDLDAASLSFAATHVLSLTFFPRWLGSVESRLSMGPIQTVSDSSYACEDLMLQRRVQFVLCHGHAGAPGRLDEGQYPVQRLSEDVLVPVSAPDAGAAPLHVLGAGQSPSVLAYSEASGLGRIMRSLQDSEFGKDFAASLSIVFTAHHAALLRTMALEGRGLAWLPMSLVADDLRGGALVDAGAGGWRVPVDIRLYRQQAQMAPVAEALWALVSEGA
ncbi:MULTISPECIES: LysR family transcriptional regulator [Variovorax]|uniref:LysR family transcriptional regulator n=1 Tax=Variovorax TaxID=34072 RepID=UPI0008693A5D|nr:MULTISPECIES: LysR family transcriptional regulator [Variovorax]MBN8757807.1 LysR family transcriptional regulator [Variovorax sp.]ODU18063.1 MAG: LysR family transcriptional regulator [Variovorax sp. SCN 67-85]ODV24598.1 MAG: LysR family transcriptional regulator [Variovorax sp. SCN 67-20]OJZ13753.1 MAG: LysR family transcriptional regulator [Variovorax sp. 67-131]UKI06107.1 LysR family transcriptional regulator [Variovorax paradoxus]